MTDVHAVDAHETREKILASAAELFAQQGYENTSLSQVARRAKVSKALIFWHFDSKETLYQNAVRRTLEPYFIEVEGIEDLGEREQIERLIDLFYDFVHENVYSVRFFLHLTLRGESRPDESLSRVNELYRVFRRWLAEIIERGRARGAFRADVNAEREAALMVAALIGILVQQFMTDEAASACDLIGDLKIALFQRLSITTAEGPAAGRPE